MSLVLPISAPTQVAPPTGTSTLPIIELSKPAVETGYTRIRFRKGSKSRAISDCSFGDFAGSLKFSAWEFFHAAKKTELTSSFTTQFIDRRALGFAEDCRGLFVWDTDNFRRENRSVFALEDFAESGLAGRCGEAIAYLTMVKWGYLFWDRIATLWERAAAHSGMTHPEMVKWARVISSKLSSRPDLEPDFAFENDTPQVALMEAKGSFVHPVRDNPTTKADLRHGLKQLNAWSGMIAPPPHKFYAIGTYFRDVSDATGDPSLIAFVDPVGDNEATVPPVEFPPDWIRRGNYGAWLVGMGFPVSGTALRNGREISPPEQVLNIVRLGRREYAVTFQGAVVKRNRPRRFRFPMPWIEPWFFLDELWDHPEGMVRVLREMGIAGIRVMGIEVGLLHHIQDVVLNSASETLLHIEAGAALAEESVAEGFTGSVMPDGTLLGQIEPDMLANTSTERFRL